MSDLLKRIADYFANEYDGDDKTAPKMELSVDELRYIASMNVERCRAESELRELKNERCMHTNGDRIRSMSDEELSEFIGKFLESMSDCENCPAKTEVFLCVSCADEILDWLRKEVEE